MERSAMREIVARITRISLRFIRATGCSQMATPIKPQIRLLA
jgi:hypothetical protein